MSITPEQKRLCQDIVSLFETDAVMGDYGNVTVIPGDSGNLTYGKAQTTLSSGNLYKLLAMYVARAQGFSGQVGVIRRRLPQLEACDPALNDDFDLKQALHYLGDRDPVMREVQDEFFDSEYWHPAAATAESLWLKLPLSWAVVYDSFVHGSFGIVRKRFAQVPPVKGGDERDWVIAYVHARRAWFLTNKLHGELYHADDACVYRMDTFMDLIAAGNWQLTLPFTVRGHVLK